MVNLATRFVDSFRREIPAHGYEPRGPAIGDKSPVDGVVDEKSSDTNADYGNPNYANVQGVHITPDGGAILTSDESGLKRNLSGRHMQMIAFGGSIGTGLFIGSGGALASGGPGFLLIDFLLIGAMLYTVVMDLGELATVYPVSGSFSAYSTRFIDPAWGFAMGWNYWMQWFIVLPLELTAASIVLQYWDPTYSHVPAGVYIMIFLVAIIFINMFGVRGYGEFESAASIIKIIAVLGFIILSIIIDTGGAPDGVYRGARTWHDPGAFKNGFQGFVSIFVTAAFAFAGTELVGLAAAETGNPRKEVPKACKQIFWRILIFYIISLFMIGLIVPHTDERLTSGASSYDARASPFVIAIVDAKIRVLPSIFNAVILVSVLSVGNSAVYGASRTLCGLAQSGQAPAMFKYIDREGRPIPAVIVSLLMGCLAFVLYAGPNTNNTVFNWLLALSGLSSIFSWGSINLAHIRFRKAWARQGHTLDELPWASPTGIWGSYFGLIFNILVLVFQFVKAAWPISPSDTVALKVSDFFQSYLAFPVVMIFYIGYKIIKRTRVVKIDEIDLSTGRRDPLSRQELQRERDEEKAKPFYIRAWRALC